MFALPIADKLLLRSQEERDIKMLLIDAVGGIETACTLEFSKRH